MQTGRSLIKTLRGNRLHLANQSADGIEASTEPADTPAGFVCLTLADVGVPTIREPYNRTFGKIGCQGTMQKEGGEWRNRPESVPTTG
jgi:hypothetical protein